MSQIHLEQPHFPWLILVIAVVSGILLYKIGQWIYEYLLWMWNNRPSSRRHSKKSKRSPSPKRKKRRNDSSDSDSDSDSSSD